MSDDVDILVVDDEERNLLAAEATLEDLGVRVLRARSGPDALRILLEKAVPLIVLDVHMPGMDGFEVARAVRAAPRTRQVPIIFLTANTDRARVTAGYEEGAVDYLFKPIDPVILRAKVSVFVELHRAKEREAKLMLAEARQRWEAETLRTRLEQERATAEALTVANQKLELALRQTKEALATREQFLRLASHELKTPLTSMRLTVDNTLTRARRLSLSEQTLERPLKVLGGQVERLARLVEELLSVVVMQEAPPRLAPREAELGALVGRCSRSSNTPSKRPIAPSRFRRPGRSSGFGIRSGCSRRSATSSRTRSSLAPASPSK